MNTGVSSNAYMDNLIPIVAFIFALVIAFYLLKYAYFGASGLLAWAAEQGFIGVAAYFACWIFLFPFMLLACVIVGAYINQSHKKVEKLKKQWEENYYRGQKK